MGGDVLRRRFISFVLAVLILIPLIPGSVHSSGLVKEIDVLMNGFRLSVEKKSFSHKEVFIHDGKLYVPMKDLSKSLGLSMNYDESKRILNLSSSGKLNFSDSSMANISYQRGYEILAKERMIAVLHKDIADFESGKKITKNAKSDVVKKNIRVGFSNIKVNLDGKTIELDSEPLLYNSDVYLDLASLSPYLYITPIMNGNEIDIDTNKILISPMGELSFQLAAMERNLLNDRLANELADLNKKKKILMDVKIPYRKIQTLIEMEKYLNDYLGKIEDVNINISLSSGTDSWYYIDIDFSSREVVRWNKLSRRSIEAYIWDVYVAISSLYDEDVKLQGAIRNPSYSSSSSNQRRNYVTFDTVIRNLEFNFYYSNLQDVTSKIDPVFIVELLKKNLSNDNRVYFDYSARISGYDLELLITPSSDTIWTKWDASMKQNYLNQINILISREYPNLKVHGKIMYSEMETISFSILNGTLSSDSLNLSIELDLNSKYGEFSSGNIRFKIKYSLVKTGDSEYKLVANIDFDSNNDAWSRSVLESLNKYIQNAVSYILGLMDMDLFIQIYDSKQVLLNEYSMFRNTVAMIVANPSSGDVPEGTLVSLESDTTGATIYYTTDGSVPNKSSPVFKDPISLYGDMTIKAFGVKEGLKESAIATFEYKTIPDSSMASRLVHLSVDNATLNPLFDSNSFKQDFTVKVPYGMGNAVITAEAKSGSLLANDIPFLGGKATVPLVVGANTIKIIHREDNKTDRVYTIVITREAQGESRIKLTVNEFSASILGVFKGELTGELDNNYGGYVVALILRDKSGTEVERTSVSDNGKFEFTFDVELKHKLIGYKYVVYKGTNIVIEPTEINYSK